MRSKILAIKSTKHFNLIKAQNIGNSALSNIEHIEPYGLHTMPPIGTDIFVDDGTATTQDLVFKPKIVDGEVVLYNNVGVTILLTKDRGIKIVAPENVEISAKQITIKAKDTLHLKADNVSIECKQFAVKTLTASIKNSTGELFRIVNDIVSEITQSTTGTLIGPQPLLPAAINLAATTLLKIQSFMR